MNTIDKLAEIGTATWLDDLSRERITSGNLAEIIDSKSIVGVTTNPSIFQAAMTSGDAYDEQIAELKGSNIDPAEAVYAMSVKDVQDACDLFLPIYKKTKGEDGRISIEVDPRLANDTDATIAQARELWKQVSRPNTLIKIPATPEGLPAIADAIAEGISVNVTLIFSVDRYRKVIDAYIDGITRAAKNGLDVSQIRSVASFFVSRVDTEVDNRLDAIGSPEALGLKGKAGLANARLAYAKFTETFDAIPLPAGAHAQRPLWASTGVKNPDYPDTLYVSELAGPQTVNTMPEKTLDAALDSDALHGDTLSDTREESERFFEELTSIGVDTDDVFAQLEREGVEKFVASWQDLLDSMSERLS